ncbi:MAG TPA: carboxypeptidase regulatory-like domain-containing protein [Bryobacteraceae bacterium]|jgi:hypothetical protein
MRNCLVLVVCVLFGIRGFAQSGSGTIHGVVLDPSGAVILGARVELRNPVSQYDKTVQSTSEGKFEFDNVPFNTYHLAVTMQGFQATKQDVNIRTAVPLEVQVTLKLGASEQSVTVSEAGDLVETDPSSHTDIDRNLFDKLPTGGAAPSLSDLVTKASPGVSGDSNGQMHGLGDHASNSFSLDGQSITDQQSKAFSNQIPTDSVQSMEVIEGAPPAEYGDKTSLVVVVTTRSGLGAKPPHGEITTSYGSFGSVNGGANLSYGGDKWGNFISVNGLDTSRFLDGPEFATIHDRGNAQNIFDRIDFKPTTPDSINVNLFYTRSWFQTPNSYDAQNATAWNGLVANNGGIGPNGLPVGSEDQRSKIRTFNFAPAWTHLMSAHTIFTLGAFVRQDQFNYYPSRDPYADFTPDLQSQTIGQNRRLTNAGARASVSYVNGKHNLKAGVQYTHTFLDENDQFGVVDPTANAVCLNSDGSPYLGGGLTNPANCTGPLQANPNFNPLIGCYDLTRTGSLPASDGCPGSVPGLYTFHGHADIKQLALYIQDTITVKNWTFNLGLRGDFYNGLSAAKQAEPRLGLAYNIKPTSTVLRLSYARTMETPFNENLVLASEGCNDPVINALQSAVPGGACVTNVPLSPGHRNEFHAGLSQAFGRYLVFDGEYIWKYTHKGYDFSVLGATPITYPIEWESSKIPGYAVRASMPGFHGLSAFVAFSSVAGRFFGPQISGIGAAPGASGSVFRIDHDERFNQTSHIQYQPSKNMPWISFSWRYDSGQVAGPVPCAGGDCNNGPNGTDSIIDVSQLTPDQQFQAGLFCGAVYATPTTPISASGLCPAAQYGSKYLKIPAPGTENDDHNPPRIASRNLFDAAIGDDNLFHGDKYKWSARLTAVNLTNKEALYNFLSTFSGTHYVTPRAITASIGFHF